MSCAKRQKIEHESASCSSSPNFVCDTFEPNLLNFSDDVLLNIFSNLIASDLQSLSQTCERMHNLCQDRTLWDVADFRGRRMRTPELSSILPMLQKHTITLAVRGLADMLSHREAGIMPVEFLRQLSTLCPRLETIIIEDFYIDVETVDCRDFPSTIKCLSMKGCQVMDSAKVRCLASDKSHFFLQVYVHLPNLEKLVLSYCRWFRLHSLMAISKCPNLLELRLDGIRHLHDNVPYLSLATSFGFRKLKILDMRNTTVGSSAMRGFNNLLSLTHLYLECPPQYRQSEGSDPAAPAPSDCDHCPESSDEECEEVNVMKGHENSCVIVLRFGNEPEVWHSNACSSEGCSSRKEKRVLHLMRNEDQGEGTSRQDSESVSENSTSREENDQATSSNGEGSADVRKSAFEQSIDASSANANCSSVVDNAEVVEDKAICVPNLDSKCDSESCSQKHDDRNAIEMGTEIKEVDIESGPSTAETNTATRLQTDENKDINAEKNRDAIGGKNKDVVTEKNGDVIAEKTRAVDAEKLIDNEESAPAQNEQPHCSNCEDLCTIKKGSSTSKIVYKTVNFGTDEVPGNVCKSERNTEGSESSDSGSSDDEGSSESDCMQPECNMKARKRENRENSRLHSVELFASARNAKCSRSSCLSGRHEELIDDLSIDYFLSRDMWRVSLDGNIVRCNDRSPRLHTLVMRFYPHVTDKTLNLLRKISSLRYVDVTGTRVTENGVESLRLRRPDVTVVSDFGELK